MSADIVRQIARSNEAFSKVHKPSISFKDFPNIKAVLIISCMDPRADPHDFWGLDEAAGIPIVRNAGGRADEGALRSARVLSGIMGYGQNTVGAIAVVHHTDCGLRCFTNREVGDLLKSRAGLKGARADEVDRMDFGSWKDEPTPEDSVRTDMQILKNDPYLPKEIEVIGFVYDIVSGKTTEICVV